MSETSSVVYNIYWEGFCTDLMGRDINIVACFITLCLI